MLFTTDQQTIEDLNIFGKHSRDSVYMIFNQTSTRGGAELLEEMFRYPLSNAEAINKRVRLFRYFSTIGPFPFNNELFDVAEQYLQNTDERTKLLHDQENVVTKLTKLIVEDSNHKFVSSGVSALAGIFNSTRQLSLSLEDAASSPYSDEWDAINGLLSDPVFEPIFKIGTRDKLPYDKLAGLDKLLRFRNRQPIQKLLRYLYELDVYMAVGKTAEARGFVFPLALDGQDKHLEVEGVYHPQLKEAVANDFLLGNGNNMIFLTGANMAGKSTFMKSLGTAIYLAHMGFPVAAKRMEFSVMDGIYTTINLPDNLGAGTSHFYAEVLRVKKLAKELNAGKNLFVIVDELFRGTNVKDAYKATIAIASGFAASLNSMFVISTHIIEAGEVLRDIAKNISFRYLPTKMDNNMPIYTYTLEEGITDDRHGMVIINNEGIIELLKNGIKKNEDEFYNR